ncbi:MAG TPA: copper amine oxidase N-terminal domain-containing protein [Candidatus Agathobaculum intestinipullorum]|nr:copper amine oxidase N-terminal domain-containing protein [Candidatus Agathobaculum intestinipullorum]
MFKKLISSLLAASMLATFASAASGNTQTAEPSLHAIYVDGTKANVAAYEINDNNYFKLRDIAAIVNGSEKQFEVSWNNDAQRIDRTSGKPYTTVGGELGAIGSASKKAESSTAVVYKDNTKMDYTGYNIDDNNYYKLRDVCESFNIGIKWDGTNQRVDILTDESYVDDSQETEKPDEHEGKIYLNGVWIDGIVKVDGKETALIVNGQEYGPDEKFVLDGKTYIVVHDPIFNDQLIPIDYKDPNEPEEDDAPEIPSYLKMNEFTDDYLAFLEDSGELIITKTIKYQIYYKGRPFQHAVKLAVKDMDRDVYITMFESNSDGSGEFKISMTQSDYEAEMNDELEFYVTMANGGSMEFDGKYYMLGGGSIHELGLNGARLHYQVI